jgi:hypothetical protein
MQGAVNPSPRPRLLSGDERLAVVAALRQYSQWEAPETNEARSHFVQRFTAHAQLAAEIERAAAVRLVYQLAPAKRPAAAASVPRLYPTGST